MTEQINIVEVELKRINVQPGDVLCLELSADHLDPPVCILERIRAKFTEVFPGTPLLILGPGMKLTVVRADELGDEPLIAGR